MTVPNAEWCQERIAKNEASFRLINERLHAGQEDPSGFERVLVVEADRAFGHRAVPLDRALRWRGILMSWR